MRLAYQNGAVSVCPSVCLSQERTRQQQNRAAAGDVHRLLHLTRGPRKFWSDCKEFQHAKLVFL